MRYPDFDEPRRTKILVAWDGTRSFIQEAEIFLTLFENISLHVVQSLPHESIHSYGTVGRTRYVSSSMECDLYRTFLDHSQSTRTLRRAKFDVIYGDRICEIIRFSECIGAQFMVMPAFEQTAFSRWIHGDLNQRVVSKAPCTVFLLSPAHSQLVVGPVSGTIPIKP